MDYQLASDHVLFILGFSTFLLAVYIFKPKETKKPSKLSLKNKSEQWEAGKGKGLNPAENYDSSTVNVIFEHEGRTWDAYEVLGLPAGCDLEMAQSAFKKTPKTELASRAYKLIEQHLG